MTAYEFGFLSKCAEHGIDGSALLKTAGPSLRDRAAAGVPGAKERLAAQKRQAAEQAARERENPWLINTSSRAAENRQAQLLRRRALSRMTPEQRNQFLQDELNLIGNSLRTRFGLASAAAGFGGMGLVGGSAMEGAGEALASKAEGRSTAASLGRGAVAGGASYGVGKGLEYSLPRAVGYVATKIPWVERHIPGAKKMFSTLRRYALARNARDPFHRQKLTRVLNSDLPKYGVGDESAMYLSHSTAASTLSDTINSADHFALHGKYMPSMGLTDQNGVTWYSRGYGGKDLVYQAPVRYYFDDSIIKRPRTVIFKTDDAHTPTYNYLVEHAKKLGKSLDDPAFREQAYGALYADASKGYPKRRLYGEYGFNDPERPRIALKDAFTTTSDPAYGVEAGRVFETKPFYDIAASDAKAASIGVDPTGRIPSAIERRLGDSGIPYYFVREVGGPTALHALDHADFFRGKRYPAYFLAPDEMAYYFAPKIRPE